MRKLSLAAALAVSLALAHPAAAQNLNRVDVNAPRINCVFNTTCRVTVTDLATPYLGNGLLQSRTFQAAPGSPAAGKWVYQYRIDIRNVAGTTAIPLVTTLSMPVAAPIVSMDYNGDGNATDQVFIITSGGLGSVGPSTAWLHGDTLHFTFSPPVAGGSAPGAGQSSYFFGFVTESAPSDVAARIEANVAPGVFLAARAPAWMASGAAAPARRRVPPRARPVRPTVPPRP
jgi:hypothetical protein